MERPILVDSNIYIGLLRQRLDPARFLFEHYDTTQLLTCGMVRLEVLRGVRLPRLRERLEAFFSVMQYVEADARLWDDATAIAAQTDRAGCTIPGTDALIAACAFRRGAAVLTLDHDFARIPDLPILRPPSGFL